MYERIASNIRKTWFLMIGFVAFIGLIGFFFGYYTGFGMWGLAIAVVIAIAMTWGSYFASDRIALSMSRAQPADQAQYQQLHNIVEGLSIASGVPKPRLYIVNDPAPNAFATGRNPEHGAIAVTSGLLARMNRDELEGVLAHELSHIKNRDTLVMTIAVTSVGVIVLLADWMIRAMWWGGGRRNDRGGGLGAPIAILGIVLLVISPLVAKLLQLAISRQREYLADVDAVNMTRHPEGLINALGKLGSDPTVVRTASRATAHLWIESPIQRDAHAETKATKRSGALLNRLFDTHPSLDSRIEALRSIGFGGGPPPPPPPSGG